MGIRADGVWWGDLYTFLLDSKYLDYPVSLPHSSGENHPYEDSWAPYAPPRCRRLRW